MTATLRPFRRSPRLWAMSLLAWLMLVFNAGMAAPAVAATAHADMAMSTMTSGMPTHHPSSAADCCGQPSMPHCDCPTMCAPALLPLPAMTMAASLPALRPGSPSIAIAPQRDDGPPLRPPLA